MKMLRLFGGLSLLFVLGLIFRMNWWPGAGILIILGAFFFSFFFLPLLFIQEKKNGQPQWYSVIKLIVLLITGVAVTFRTMHWPGGDFLTMVTNSLWIFVYAPCFIYRQIKFQSIAVKKVSNIIFFILGICMFFFLGTSSRNFSNSFTEIEVGIVENTQKIIKKNLLILNALERVSEDSIYKKSVAIHNEADSLEIYINKIRSKLIAACDEILPSEADSISNMDVKKKSCMDIPTQILIGEDENLNKGIHSGFDLKKRIRNYESNLIHIADTQDVAFLKDGINLSTEDFFWTEDDAEYTQTWESFYFANVPLSAILTKFENIKYDIRLAENQALQYLLNKSNTENSSQVQSELKSLIDKTQHEQNQKDIELLKQEKNLYNSKLIEKNEAIQRQDRNLVLIIFTVVGVLCLLLITINSNRERKKANDLLEKQKEYIEHQKQEITDSINYAKRIQSAILPPVSGIKENFQESFVLYKPKDIVSGDFYWSFKSSTNEFLLAAADCTGHGVPGSFMSVVSSEKLTEAAKNTSDVSEILKLTNQGVKKTLRQGSHESTRDGMDVALIKLIKNQSNGYSLEYAGANRPLYHFRKTDQQWSFTEIKATKSAIGGLTPDDQIFEKRNIDLQKGDTLYIFSDGFADQFNTSDKKMMTRRFKEIILSILDKSLEEQRAFLDKYHDDWKGDMEQTDDVLVIGVRV